MGLKLLKVSLEENFKVNGFDSRIHCIKFDFKEPSKVGYHYHEYIEILFFFSGNGIVFVNGRPYLYRADTLIIVNSQLAHAIDIISPSQYACIKVMPDIFYANEFQYALPFISELRDAHIFERDKTTEMGIHSLVQDIMQEWEQMHFGFEMVIRSQLLELFVYVLRCLHKDCSIYPLKKVGPEIQTAIFYIAEHFATVTEQELANICHLIYTYFSYLFKKTIGKSFKKYLNDTKIYQAEKLLLSTKKTITEISQETGFSTTSHFIAQFKKKNGTSPAKFKKIHCFRNG